jgi:putative DNA primase/helicase
MEHTPAILSTIRINAKYDESAKCPVFIKYLHDSLPVSEHTLIQEILGYFLVPINRAQKAFVIHGKSNTGKSTLLHVVEDILIGKNNISTLTWQALDDIFSTFQLYGKLVNVFAE